VRLQAGVQLVLLPSSGRGPPPAGTDGASSTVDGVTDEQLACVLDDFAAA